MRFERASGILLHPTSLAGPYGIGDLGLSAYQWVDFLADSGCKLWQVLPLGPTGYGDSPYQCFSAFAGNPYLISPEFLLRDGLLHPDDLVKKPDFDPARVDFGTLIPWKLNLLEQAYLRFSSNPSTATGQSTEAVHHEFDAFYADNASWLDDYSLFMAIKEAHGGGSWEGWPSELRMGSKAALANARKTLKDAISYFSFCQFIFFRQWNSVRDYAHLKGIQIIGDIPIFVAMDSADIWSHPELFHLDMESKPTVVAGVPPDYFSPTGQLWGNPLYRWDVHKQTGYTWWLERIRATLNMVDIIRIDHFRGFAAYWEIPAKNLTAEQGRWVPGPGADFFETIINNLGTHSSSLGTSAPIIAEDLGFITPDVTALREQFGFPGMKVLQFAFSGPDNAFLPNYYPQDCVVYTGTHDNNTARGWFESAPKKERDFALGYLKTHRRDFAWDLIRAAWASVAEIALAPMQDFLNLGTEARMNYPSRLGGNWEWRMTEDAMSKELSGRIRELNCLYQR